MAPLVIIRSNSRHIEYQTDRFKSHASRSSFLTGARENNQDDGQDCESEQHNDVDEDSPCHVRSHRANGFFCELYDLKGLRAFRCMECSNIVADRDDVISKTFYGRTGRAFLMNSMYNIYTSSPRHRRLMTGIHTISDVLCSGCDAILGWKYIKAMEPSQRYKEGKFIMEQAVVEQDEDCPTAYTG